MIIKSFPMAADKQLSSHTNETTKAKSHGAHTSLLNISILQAGDRLRKIRAGFTDQNPYESSTESKIIKALTTSKRKPSEYLSSQDQALIGKSQINSLNKYRLREIKGSDSKPLTNPPLSTIPGRIPSIHLPDTSQKHTINTSAYLENRLPTGILKKIQSNGGEFFLFNTDSKSIADYYKKIGYDICHKISSPTSTHFYLLQSSDLKNEKVVISNISSNARLTHQILQLHYAGINIPKKVRCIGDVHTLKKGSSKELKDALKSITADQKILYIGSRKKVMEAISSLQKTKNSKVDYSGQTSSNSHKVGPYVYDTTDLLIKGNTVSIAALRMPNGDLAYEATKAFIESGFNKIIMCGAGGRLSGNANVGDYLSLKSTTYNGSVFQLNKSKTLLPEEFSKTNPNSPSNVTVDSPLVETENWLTYQKMLSTGSVDVETAHIFKAVEESNNPTTIVPGLFVSDIVGIEPLEKKISGNGADKHMHEFVRVTLDQLLSETDTNIT